MTAVGEIDIVACGGSTVDPYILKARVPVVQTPQIILNFRKQIGGEHKNLKFELFAGPPLAFPHNHVQPLFNS